MVIEDECRKAGKQKKKLRVKGYANNFVHSDREKTGLAVCFF